MTKSYKRTRNIYDPKSKKPFALSRTKIERFLECQRCFYLDRHLGVDRPGMPGFSLNSAVDELLKKEFDILRADGHTHDLMKAYKIDAIPFRHKDIDLWRDNFKGVRYLHKPTNFEIFGAIDDIWQDKNGKLYIVDYKSTSTSKKISLEDKYKKGYKKQAELYQWIFRQLGFDISNTAYFVFANATKEPDKFNKRLEFILSIITHEGKDSWVEPTIFEIKKCLGLEKPPEANVACEHCAYRTASNEVLK